MELKINAMVEHKLSPDEYVYLFYLVSGMMCPVQLRVSKDKLQEQGFIKVTETKTIGRQKAIDLLLGKELLHAVKTVSTSKTAKNKELVKSVDSWIEDWRSLFPTGIKTAGQPVRGSKQGCNKKMKTFISTNKDVTKEQIFEATKMYVKEKAMTRYAYMTVAHYFIDKGGISMLESYIEQCGIADTVEVFDQRTNNMTDDI
jgi:hypothetical protein